MKNMFYSVRHITTFVYSAPISESAMELRMQPRSESGQRCLQFELTTNPRARIHAYRDHLGNVVHHFDIPARHAQLRITTEATVEMSSAAALPDSLADNSWEALGAPAIESSHWEFLHPSHFVERTALLDGFARDLGLERRRDPLSLLREVNTGIFQSFDYMPHSTQVDSPIDDALKARQGVCQDFAHIMLALVRPLGIPARYVSGYLFQGDEHRDRSDVGATHAWIETWLPDVGWIGFDPTNNLIVGERHIRVAVGRDYADVPPTRGVFKGKADTELSVSVHVSPNKEPPRDEEMLPGMTWVSSEPEEEDDQQQQQQQQ